MKLKTILSKFTRKSNLNILTIPDDERFCAALSELPHNFFYFNHIWNTKRADRPDNFNPLEMSKTGIVIPGHLDFDLILCQNQVKHSELLNKYQQLIGVPLMVFNTYDNPIVDNKLFYNQNLKREPFILLIYDEWAKRAKTHGYYIWEALKNHIPTALFGNNAGISRENVNVEEAAHIYNKAALFLNLTLIEDEHLLRAVEAAACGCPIVSVNTKRASALTKHVFGSAAEIVNFCKAVLGGQINAEVPDVSGFTKNKVAARLNNIINEKYSEWLICD